MKWPRGTAALSVALFGRTFDADHEEEGCMARSGDEEYVLVGAGPVGLWTALQLKLRLPAANVHVYEKRTAYSREHMVRLGSDALWWSVGKELPELKTIVDVQQGGHGMKLKELEELLRGAAQRLGITFSEQSITDGNNLMEMHPNAVAIIGADGRHSVLRETLFLQPGIPSSDQHRDRASARESPEHISKRVIEHTIYINFKLEGEDALKAHNLEGGALQNIVFNAADSVLYAGHHPVRLVVGRKQDEKVSLTAIFFIDAQTAETMSSCRKNSEQGPGRMHNDDRVPAELSADIRRYMTQRFGENVVDVDGLQMVYVAIDRYCSDVIAQARGSTGLYLVGDACFGVPYFRALTNGLKCASTLAQYLAMPGVGPKTAVRAYRWYVFRLWQQALSAAEATGLGSVALGGVVALGQTLVGGKTEADEEEQEAAAKHAADIEEVALFERGFSNHRLEVEGEETGGTDAFGERRGWALASLDGVLAPITGKDAYEFGDVTRAGVRGGRALVGQSVETGVKLAAGALHGFVNLTGVKL